MLRLLIVILMFGTIGAAASATAGAQQPEETLPAGPQPSAEEPFGPLRLDAGELRAELIASAVRLPVAAVLGAALAFRPRRRGTPPRQPAVVQTQIILAVVGALIMLVVGASLARAFGIVGAANLIRYRSKIEDPKDAVVMLSALGVGLASGVGLFGLAVFGTVFLVVVLLIVESFEPQTRVWDLDIRLGGTTAQLRPRIESVLRRFNADYELRSQSEEEVSYLVTTPLALHTDRVSNALTELVDDGKGAVEWRERPKLKAS